MFPKHDNRQTNDKHVRETVKIHTYSSAAKMLRHVSAAKDVLIIHSLADIHQTSQIMR